MRLFLLLALLTMAQPGYTSAPQQVSGDLAAPASTMSISLIKTGQSNGALEAVVVNGGSWFKLRHLTHNALYIEHPKGNLLLDTGVGKGTRKAFSENSWFHQLLFAYELTTSAADQLQEAGIPLSSIAGVIPTHLHWDHSGGIPEFPNTPIWVRDVDLAHARTGHAPSFFQSHINSPDTQWYSYELDEIPYEGFKRSKDIYHDGRLILVDLSGHTPGHTGLFVNFDSGKRYFFIGDTSWTLEGVAKAEPRPSMTQWLTGVDVQRDENAAVLQKVHALSQQYPDLIIVPAHDENAAKQLPQFPERGGQ